MTWNHIFEAYPCSTRTVRHLPPLVSIEYSHHNIQDVLFLLNDAVTIYGFLCVF